MTNSIEKKFPTATEAAQMSQKTIDSRHSDIRERAKQFLMTRIYDEVIAATRREHFYIQTPLDVTLYGENLEIFCQTIVDELKEMEYKDIAISQANGGTAHRTLTLRWTPPKDSTAK